MRSVKVLDEAKQLVATPVGSGILLAGIGLAVWTGLSIWAGLPRTDWIFGYAKHGTLRPISTSDYR